MRIANRTVVLLLITLFVMACKSTGKTTRTIESETEGRRKMILSQDTFTNLQTDDYELESFEIENQTLVVTVSYGGGCGDADFEMFYQPQKLTVLPHKTKLFLKLADEDPCRSMVTKKLIFDLSPLQKEAETGGVELHLNNKMLEYRISEPEGKR